MNIILKSLEESVTITFFVFVTMLLVDWTNCISKDSLQKILNKKNFLQYIVVSLLAVMPGCLGAFINVSLYAHGFISFGALLGGMIASSGDEAFVMLAMFPQKSLLIFAILFVLGIFCGYGVDKIFPFLGIKQNENCIIEEHEHCFTKVSFKVIIENLKKITFTRVLIIILLVSFLYLIITGIIGEEEWDWEKITSVILLVVSIITIITVPQHYLDEHIFEHLIKKHLWKIFLWTFGALTLISVGLNFFDLEKFVKTNMLWVLLISVIIGIIPESGPHILFVVMFAKGWVPLSVLLASCIVQDGHGMLPLLSYSVKDVVRIKIINVIIGLSIGGILFLFGY